MKRFTPIFEILKVIVAVFVVAVIIRYVLFQPFIVEGSSMEPNFHNGEYIIVEKINYHLHAPKRGDVIVMEYPGNTSIDYIKRIIGLPGETIMIKDGNVYVDGNKLTESYLLPNQTTTIGGSNTTPYQITLTSDQYFMMGDNRDHSSDSRDWGVLTKDKIIGKAAIVLYPSRDFHAIAAPSYN